MNFSRIHQRWSVNISRRRRRRMALFWLMEMMSWNDGQKTPNRMSKSVFITSSKKPNVSMEQFTSCATWLLQRMKGKIRSDVPVTQFGFVEDKDKRKAIFTIGAIIDHNTETQKDFLPSRFWLCKGFGWSETWISVWSYRHTWQDGKDLEVDQKLYWKQQQPFGLIAI